MSLAGNNHLIATADLEHDVKLWDLSVAQAGPSEWENRSYVNLAAVCDDQDLAFVASNNRYEIWDMATGRPFEEQEKIATDRLIRRGNSLVDPQVEENLRAQLQGVPGLKKREMGIFEKIATKLRDWLEGAPHKSHDQSFDVIRLVPSPKHQGGCVGHSCWRKGPVWRNVL
jgi:hypothetical protein